MKKVTLLALNLQSELEQASHLSAHPYLKLLPKTKRQAVSSFDDPLSCAYQMLGGEGALPIAALQAQRYRLAPSAHWVLAEPIECQADHRTVYCLGSAHLHITHEEVVQLLDTLNQHLQADGLHLYAPTPECWLLAMDQPWVIDAMPLSQVLNQDIQRCAPKVLAQEWKRLFVELEMLLHQHPVNQAREKKGYPKINACWFSGAGELKVMPPQPQTAVLSDDPLIRTLGEWASAQTSTLSQDYASAMGWCEKEIDHLMVVPAYTSLSSFENLWLGPIMDAVSAKKIQHLAIYAGDKVCYDVMTQNKRIKLPFF